jgi:23S rRNA (uracil1939-C5)-methyltransferase
VRIESLAAGGEGIGHLADGRVVFVPLAAPGDLCEIVLVEDRPRYARASLVRVLEPSEERVNPKCGVFGRCGGCEWQHLAYPAQLRAKAELIRAALTRLGGIEWGEVQVTPSPSEYGYRQRARVVWGADGVGFRERRSHRVCVIEQCPVLAAPLNAHLKYLERGKGEVELLAGTDGEVRAGHGSDPVAIEVAGQRFAVSPGVFVQSNGLMLDVLTEAVAAAAGAGGVLLELFAGAGFLTLGLSRSFERVWAVEANPAAALDLERNLRSGGATNVRVSADGADDLLGEFAAFAPEVVVLDPPRSGISPELAGCLAALPTRRVVYLSCDPATLARDLQILTRSGLRLEAVSGFDLFPQTSHVETLAVLTRS